jgi:hypothetical protein
MPVRRRRRIPGTNEGRGPYGDHWKIRPRLPRSPGLGKDRPERRWVMAHAAGGRATTPNPLILGLLSWLFVDSADYLRLSRLQTLVVRG